MIKSNPIEDRPIACETCRKEIPRSAASSLEGPDYFYYFCGGECYEKWVTGQDLHEIELEVRGIELDFVTAKVVAQDMARGYAENAMLLAWSDRQHGRKSPEVPERQHKSGCLDDRESRGGGLKIDINRGAYVFIFTTRKQD